MGSVEVCKAGTDYAALLEAVEAYRSGFSDTNALQTIYAVAKSGECEVVTAACMGIYTLHMGAAGQTAVCQGGLLALRSRYPDAETTKQLGALDLVPSACPTCQGTGSLIEKTSAQCLTCKGSGKCLKCDGEGKTAYCPYHRCRKTFTFQELRGHYPYYSLADDWNAEKIVRCPLCGGAGIDSKLAYIKCSDCSREGKCPQCRGSGKQGAQTKYSRCPACGGVAAGVNASVARSALAKLCQDTGETLRQEVGCEKAYAEALEKPALEQRMEALNACLTQYPAALTRSQVLAKIDELSRQKVSDDLAASARQQELAAKRQQALDEHQALLQSIRNTVSKRAALVEIRKFLDSNPDSPVIVEARLLSAEIEEALAVEAKAEKRRRTAMVGCGSLMGFAFLAWVVSCIKFTRPAVVEVSAAPRRDLPPQKIPFRPRPSPQKRVLFPVTAGTAQGEAVSCPECGALLECPADVAEEDVLCGECRKAFHVH